MLTMPTGWHRKLQMTHLFLITKFTKPIRTETSNFKCNTIPCRTYSIVVLYKICYYMLLKSMLHLFWLTLLCKSLKLKVSSCSWTNDVLFLAPFKFHATLKFTILLCLFFHSKMGFITIVKMKNASFRIVQFCVLIFYCS